MRLYSFHILFTKGEKYSGSIQIKRGCLSSFESNIPNTNIDIANITSLILVFSTDICYIIHWAIK